MAKKKRNSNGQSYFENGISTDDLSPRSFDSPSKGMGNSYEWSRSKDFVANVLVPPAGCVRTRRPAG
ncbi:MAG: hypothetical protein LBC30_01160 [Puniceicoccales bacterium]|nr:hypothetical protein [Puniceicoccales bacterium]